MRKILVLRGGALGDLIVTLPALAALRRTWPGARIELAGNTTAAVLALDAKLIAAAHSQHEARWGALFSSAPLTVEFAAWLGTFDLVVNFWPDPEGELAHHFPAAHGQKYIAASALPQLAPAAAHFCAALQPIGIQTAEYFFPLALPHQIEACRIALHPGSGSPAKNWPLDRWISLCEWLRSERDAELLIITGEAETADARALARFGVAAHCRPLRELAARTAACRLFIGHDSGVSHLAAACNVACVLLFGPTDPAVWAPPASAVRVLRSSPALTALTLADVQRAVLDSSATWL